MGTLKTSVVLLIDGDFGEQRLIEDAFNQWRADSVLFIFGDGKEAFAYLQQSKDGIKRAPMPDFILINLDSPSIGAVKLLEKLQLDKELKRIPVFTLTNSETPEEILKSQQLNVAGYMKKPVSKAGFGSMIRNFTESLNC